MTMNLDALHGSEAPSFVPTESTTGTNTAAPAPAMTLLPEPGHCIAGDDLGAEIAALAVKTGEVDEEIDTRAAETQDQVQDEAEAAQVSTLHDEASATRSFAWASGCLQIGAGALSMASGGEAMGSGNKAAGIAGLLKGASEATSGAGTIVAGLGKAAATDMDAQATASKALADAAQRSGGELRDGQKSASAFVQSAVDFYREYEAAKGAAQAAALHGA